MYTKAPRLEDDRAPRRKRGRPSLAEIARQQPLLVGRAKITGFFNNCRAQQRDAAAVVMVDDDDDSVVEVPDKAQAAGGVDVDGDGTWRS